MDGGDSRPEQRLPSQKNIQDTYVGPIWAPHMGPIWAAYMGPIWFLQMGSMWVSYGQPI